MQTVQLVLDKQGSIISAVAPLLPLLQMLPPLINSAKTTITEKLEENLLSRINLSSGIDSRTILPMSRTGGKRKRSSNEHWDTSSPLPDHSPTIQKRSRIISIFKDVATDDAVKASTVHIPSAPTPTSTMLTTNASANISCRLESRSNPRNPQTEDKQATSNILTTPRRPLGDVALSMINIPGPGSDPSKSRALSGASRKLLSHCVAPDSIKDAHKTDNTLLRQAQEQQSALDLGITPTAARPPRILRMQTAIAANSRASSVHTVFQGQSNTTGSASSANRVLNVSSKEVTNVEIRDRQRFAPRISAVSGTSVQESVPAVVSLSRTTTRARTPLAQISVPREAIKENPTSPVVTKSKGKNVPLTVALGRMREKRSPWVRLVPSYTNCLLLFFSERGQTFYPFDGFG